MTLYAEQDNARRAQLEDGQKLSKGLIIQSVAAAHCSDPTKAAFKSEGPPADAGGITWRTVIPGTG